MENPFESLKDLNFLQKRDLLNLVTALIDAARNEAARKFDAGSKSDKLSVMSDSIGLESLYYKIIDRRASLERDHSTSVADLIAPVLQYCNRKTS